MSNQLTTPIDNIPPNNNSQPNSDIDDPLVKELLDNMQSQPVIQEQPQSQTQPQPQSLPQYYPQQIKYPSQPQTFHNIYDPKIIFVTAIMVVIIYLLHTSIYDNILLTFNNEFIENNKFFIKYILLYLILYIIQKYVV
jgi:hypothetical protein|tara:strand:+ start:312 stop:725 length:414 start_codon:yes stop_codon:yes gene_type:complete